MKRNESLMRWASLLAASCVVMLTAGQPEAWMPSASQSAAVSEKPNFSGVWTRIPERQPQSSPGTLIVDQPWAQGQPVTIAQDASSITIAYVSNSRNHGRILLTYNLDGTETMNSGGSSPGPRDRPSTATWDGASLVLISIGETRDRTTGAMARNEFRDRLTLESSTTLRLETSRTVKGDRATREARFQRAGPPPGRGSGESPAAIAR